MNRFTPAIFFIATMAGGASCKKEIIGEGPVITETRSLARFTAIDLQMNGNVYYTNDAEWKVVITAKESIHPVLETNVVNNRLVVRYSNGKTYDADESIRIVVSAPAVNRFELSSSGNIYSASPVQQQQVFLRSNGSGSILMQQIETGDLDAESNVSGCITIAGGRALQGRIKTDGSGKVDAAAMLADKLNARIIGSGDIKVKVSEQLEARIDGSGSVFFSGFPFIISDISGTGKLIHL